jgi:hypothetical protein
MTKREFFSPVVMVLLGHLWNPFVEESILFIGCVSLKDNWSFKSFLSFGI